MNAFQRLWKQHNQIVMAIFRRGQAQLQEVKVLQCLRVVERTKCFTKFLSLITLTLNLNLFFQEID